MNGIKTNMAAVVLAIMVFSVFAQKPASAECKCQFSRLICEQSIAVKTNLLYDALTAINLEVEMPIGGQWSAAGELIFPWWLLKQKQYCLQSLIGNLECRYWFSDREYCPYMTGWFAGVCAGGGYYDAEWKRRGRQGEFFSAGLSAGYVHQIGRKGDWRMEYSLSAGYMRTQYRKYDSVFDDRHWRLESWETGVNKWFGPTRAKVSLIWMFHYGKGGQS